MSQQDIPPQSIVKGNQQLQAQTIQQQHNPSFEAGKAIFEKLSKKQAETYDNFRQLTQNQMSALINDFKFWRTQEGPQNSREQFRSNLYLQSLKGIQQQEWKRRMNTPKLLLTITDWFDQMRTSNFSLTFKKANEKTDKVKNLWNTPQSQDYDLSHSLLDIGKKDARQEETKPFKWQ